jgi:hypothetical protein
MNAHAVADICPVASHGELQVQLLSFKRKNDSITCKTRLLFFYGGWLA